MLPRDWEDIEPLDRLPLRPGTVAVRLSGAMRESDDTFRCRMAMNRDFRGEFGFLARAIKFALRERVVQNSSAFDGCWLGSQATRF